MTHPSAIQLGLILLAFVTSNTQAQSRRTVPQQYAVLVGVSDYPQPLPSLRGASLNDVALMRELLTGRYGFPTANVAVLTDREATRDGIIRAVREHLGKAGPDDVALLFFSGHGIQLDTTVEHRTVRGMEADGLDEALLVMDATGERATYLLDDEVGLLMDGLRARRTIVVVDACHSGTATRALYDEAIPWSDVGTGAPPNLPSRPEDPSSAFVPRRILLDDARPVIVAPDSLLTGGRGVLRRSHLVLSAARDEETALAGPLRLPDGSQRPVGMFTAALYLALGAATPSTTFAQVIAVVRRAVAPVARKIQGTPQTPTASGPWQSESLQQLFRSMKRAPGRPERLNTPSVFTPPTHH